MSAPANVGAVNLAAALQREGRLAEAERLYLDVLQADRNDFNALHLLGVLRSQQGRHEEAIELIERALRRHRRYADAYSNLGNALHAVGRDAEAVTAYGRALALRPEYAEAHSNLGDTLYALKRHEEAVQSCRRALAIRPNYVEAYSNLGNALHALGRSDEALAAYDKALAIDPRFANALGNRGLVLLALDRYAEAMVDLYGVLQIEPDRQSWLGPLHYLRIGCCDWRNYDDDVARIVADVRTGRRSALPLSFMAVSDSPADQLVCARAWARDELPAADRRVWRGSRYRHDRIRIAYLSGDFREHPVAYLTAGLFERHDRTRFETFGLAFTPGEGSPMRTRLARAFDRFLDVGDKSDAEVALLLRDLEIDIAIDLMGYTGKARPRIFGQRPAPVQVAYLGYPGTLGVDFMDYLIADETVIPREERIHYAEQVVYLPDSFLVNDAGRAIAPTAPPRTELGLPKHGFVFCTFNNPVKVTPTMFDVWMQLLREVEGSVLWLTPRNAIAGDNLRREARARGVDPDRLVFAGRVDSIDQHLARHRLADLFLDTLPYNAHSTLADALWVGLPAVTCLGSTFPGRVAASLLKAAGLPELIVNSLDEYHALALDLATGAARLAEIRARLDRHRLTCPLFDTDRFRGHLERAYTVMWERAQRREPPSPIEVAPSPYTGRQETL